MPANKSALQLLQKVPICSQVINKAKQQNTPLMMGTSTHSSPVKTNGLPGHDFNANSGQS